MALVRQRLLSGSANAGTSTAILFITGNPNPLGAGWLVFAGIKAIGSQPAFTWPANWSVVRSYLIPGGGKLEWAYTFAAGGETGGSIVVTHAAATTRLAGFAWSGAAGYGLRNADFGRETVGGQSHDAGTRIGVPPDPDSLAAILFTNDKDMLAEPITLTGMPDYEDAGIASPSPGLWLEMAWATIVSTAATVPGLLAKNSGTATWESMTAIFSPTSTAPKGLSGAPEYVIELYDSGATFGPNSKLAEIWDARNVGWSRYDRIPGKAFFTLPQTSPLKSLLVELTTHIAIWRITPAGETLVWRGAVIDADSTGDDIVFDCYDYLALLSLSRAGFKTLYPTKKLGSEIVSPEWAAAKGASSSPLGFVTDGFLEDPLGTDGVTLIKTNAQFGTLDQSRLQLFFDLTEMGRANTINHVTYDIDLTNTFNFYKNKGAASSIALVLNGTVSDYHYLPNWKRYRNDLATIGTASAGGPSEIVAVKGTEVTAKGRRQDVTTLRTLLGIAGAATEADQQKASLERALKRAYQQESVLSLALMRGTVEPYVGWNLCDTVPVEISNGRDSIVDTRRIVGVRTIFNETGEDMQLLVGVIAT